MNALHLCSACECEAEPDSDFCAFHEMQGELPAGGVAWLGDGYRFGDPETSRENAREYRQNPFTKLALQRKAVERRARNRAEIWRAERHESNAKARVYRANNRAYLAEVRAGMREWAWVWRVATDPGLRTVLDACQKAEAA